MPLLIRMLGSLVVERDGVVIAQLEGQRYGALLGQLAARPGRAISREVLLATHWPEVDPSVARNRLSVALSVLRKQLGDATIFQADRSCVALNPAQVVTDVQRFEQACARAREAAGVAARRAALEEAWRIYSGPLLQGFDEDWIDIERERLACAHEDVEKALQIEEAVPTDPLPPPPQAAAPTAPLPAPATRFFGRDAELAAIEGLVEQGARLVTVLGLGGMGKTRLAIAAAGRLVAAGSRQEAIWVPVVDARSAAALQAALLSAVGGPPPLGDPQAALASRLAGRRAVLVIDNAEHIVEEVAAAVSALLAAVPDLVVLATSQRALLIDGEHRLRLPPLTEAAVALLTDRIRFQRPDYCPDAAERRALEALVARLDGVPLALELAAARLRQGSAAEALAQLDPSNLRDRRRDRPRRQRSLEDALAWTLALLDEPLRRRFLQLSVFPGEIAVDAARAVIGGDRVDIGDDMVELMDSSLLVPIVEATGRARMLPTVRALADAYLSDEERAAAQERFRGWFLDLTHRWNRSLNSAAAKPLAVTLVRDQVNLDRALDLAAPQDAARALVAVVIHVLWTGRARELLPRYEALAQRAEAEGWELVLRGGLVRCGHRLAHVSGQAEIAARWRDRARALLAIPEQLPERMVAGLHAELALAALDQGALAEAEASYIAQCEYFERSSNSPRDLAVTLDALSRVYYFMGDMERALETNARAAAAAADQVDPQLQETIAGLRAACLAEISPERGLAALQEVAAQSRASGRPESAGLSINLALAEVMAGRPGCVEATRAALEAARGDLRLEVFAHEALAVALSVNGAPEEALHNAEIAIRGFRELRRPLLALRPLIVRATCLLRLGAPDTDAAIGEAIRAALSIEGHFRLRLLAALIAERWPERAAPLQAAREADRWRPLLEEWLA
jgi:predicted ATPase/tetratricopeptide (TPR) repeat protein